MNNIHQEYVDFFLKAGSEKLESAGYTIEVTTIDGPDGLTAISLLRDSILNKVVRFAYNRLDYNLGVIVYAAKAGKMDSNEMLLPKQITSEADTYGYMGETMNSEVERLIKDICEKL